MSLNDMFFGHSIGEPNGVSVPLDAEYATAVDTPVEGAGDNFDVPSIEDELAEGVRLDTALESLCTLKKEILRVGGMSQAFAMEAEQLVPGFDAVPIGYYTEKPSATRYTASLEAISGGIVALIVAGIAALTAIIYKIFRWLTGKGEDDKVDPKKAAKEVKANVEEFKETMDIKSKDFEDTAKAADKVDTAARKGLVFRYSKVKDPIEFKSIDQLFALVSRELDADGNLILEPKDRAFRYLRHRDALLNDLLEDGPYLKIIKQTNLVMSIMPGHFKDRMKGVEEAVVRDIHEHKGKTEQAIKKDLFKAGGMKEPTSDMEHRFRFPYNGKDITVAEFASMVSDARMAYEGKTVDKTYTISAFCKRMGEVMRDDGIQSTLDVYASAAEMMAGLEEALDKTTSVLGNAFTDTGDVEYSHNPAVMQACRDAIHSIRTDLGDLRIIMSHIDQFRNTLQRYSNEACGHMYRLAEALCLYSEIYDDNKGKLPPEFDEFHQVTMKANDRRYNHLLKVWGSDKILSIFERTIKNPRV